MDGANMNAQVVNGRYGGRRREASSRLRLPLADHVVAGGWHSDGGTDGIGGFARTGPFLRRYALYTKGNRRRRERTSELRGFPTTQRPSHHGRFDGRKMGSPVQPGGCVLPSPLDQI